MGKLIDFYVPVNFKWSCKWIPPEERGKIIEFRQMQTMKSA